MTGSDSEPRPIPPLRAYAMLGVVMILWAGNSIVGRAMRHDIPPFTLAYVRWIVALCVLAPFAARQTWADRATLLRHWRPILLLGVIGVGGFNGFLYIALRYTTATNSLLIQALIPALVLLINALAFRERSSRLQIAAVLLSTFGVFAIVFRGDPMAVMGLHFGFGDLLMLCGCVAWAIYTACLRLRPPVHGMSFMFITFIIAALTMAPLAATEAQAIAAIHWRPEIFAAFAYVGIFPSVIAYFLYNSAVERIGAGAAGQTISTMPLFGALLAAMLLGEPLLPYHGVGMGLILAGVTLGGWAITRRSAVMTE